ncbi:hypothetical protein [Lacrimispora sp.]|uniref:hypothetical protein n=1 Tax=Lacrimispora sp. TaxID=2719234 RepID=UPI003994EA31
MSNDNNLKIINLTRYNGSSINLSGAYMSGTNFQKGQVLQTMIYSNMIVIIPAIPEDQNKTK